MKKLNPIVVSPITGLDHTEFLYDVDTNWLVTEYERQFEIDIKSIFNDDKEVKVYRCLDTGFTFFYPFNLAGDKSFYEKLGRLNWYYDPWRWEHEITLNLIKENEQVLEVGAGSGEFLKVLDTQGINCIGLDLNEEKSKAYSGKKSKLIAESLDKYAPKHKESFETVCSFQFLEHIANVKDTIEAMLYCLKPGGKLIISVPNNESFIGSNILPTRILNMPPHHLGLWTAEAFEQLPNYFPIKLYDIKFEPLQDIHRNTYLYNFLYTVFFRSKNIVKLIWKFRIYYLLRPISKLLSHKILGHSMLVIYEKY